MWHTALGFAHEKVACPIGKSGGILMSRFRKERTIMVILRWALAAGLLASWGFCLMGFWTTFGAASDPFIPTVYSLLIVCYGIGTARVVRRVPGRV